MSLLDVLLPRPTGRRRKVLPTRTNLRRQIAELEELRREDRIAREVAEQKAITYGHLFTAYDEQLRSEATARRANWANEHAVTTSLYAHDEDTITIPRIPAVQPLWQSPMAVTR